MENNNIHGFKVFGPDWTCRDFQYEVGKTYTMEDSPVCCQQGFHFCLNAADCFSYYSFDPSNKVAKIIALGDMDSEDDSSKCCTNKLQIVREIPWDEVLRIVNTGKNCTGLRNTGNWNTGDQNTGNRNTGNQNTGSRNVGSCNTGNQNTGNCNTGNQNTGNWNAGDWNAGSWNTGSRNTGNQNTGDYNTGYQNAGNWNVGDWNTGNRNTGDRNTGYRNAGNRNTGNRNTGDRNTGDYNTGYQNAGNWNVGDWNRSSFNTGCFMTEEQKISMFNKPTDWTYQDWLESDARHLLNQIPRYIVKWIHLDEMTDEEKANHPSHETTGGYLKVLDESKCGQLWWDSLSACQKDIIKAIPNFDPEIFEQCTGIKTEE